MDENLTKDYLRRVIGNFSFKHRLLCWNAFRCHIMDSVKDVLHKMKIDTAVVPGGCTKYIQPADVSWNKPFNVKNSLHDQYDDFISDDANLEFTKNGNPKAPPLEISCQWIVNA